MNDLKFRVNSDDLFIDHNITVNKPSSIGYLGNTPIELVEGQLFNPKNITIILSFPDVIKEWHYSGNESKIKIKDLDIPMKLTDKYITLNCCCKELTIPVTVEKLTILSVSKSDVKIIYIEGEFFDPKNLILKLNDKEDVFINYNTINPEYFEFKPKLDEKLNCDNENIEITYFGAKTKLQITVKKISSSLL